MIAIRKLEWHLIFFALPASLALVGCARLSQQQDQAADVNIALAVHPDPPAVGPANLTVFVTGADGRSIDGASLHIKGDMSHVGMQPVLAEFEGGHDGEYQTPFEWTMGGDWIVSVAAALPDGRTTARQFTYTVEGDIRGFQPDNMVSEMAETE
jgi:hypothetical protein